MLGVQEVIGSTAEVVVSHCTSWKQFWVQRRSEEVAQLAAQLDTTDPAVLGSPLTSPQVATCRVSVSQTLVLFLTVPVPLHQWKKDFFFFAGVAANLDRCIEKIYLLYTGMSTSSPLLADKLPYP